MHRVLLLSGLLSLVSALGCASGGSTSNSGGSAGGTATGSTTTTGSETTGSTSTGAGGTGTTTSQSSSTTTSMGGGGSGGGTGGSTPGLPLGSDCNADADCDSGLCKPVVIGVGPVCVTPCTQQSDCGASTNYFCEPVTPGSTDGYCIPHSPAHCLSCMADTDCGSLSETCFQAPGDINKACHVDCAIAGDAACPQDYSCTDQTVNGQARKLCRPKIIPTCLDALGGFCDRLQLPQPCLRQNAAGTCLGERSCLPGPKRFDKCSALAPQCKPDCSVQDPAGCMEIFCPGATNNVTNCGSCGNVCPGYQQPFADAACQNGTTCSFTCQGEHYDVDNNAGNGCEEPDPTTGNHTVGSGVNLGNISCNDTNIINGNVTLSVQITNDAFMVSDARSHVPGVSAFNGLTGSAPDWYHINATGGTCVNDISMTLQMTNSAFPNCYKLSMVTDKGTYTCQTGANGACTISKGSGSYSDDTSIDIKIEKTCDITKLESVAYTVIGHL